MLEYKIHRLLSFNDKDSLTGIPKSEFNLLRSNEGESFATLLDPKTSSSVNYVAGFFVTGEIFSGYEFCIHDPADFENTAEAIDWVDGTLLGITDHYALQKEMELKLNLFIEKDFTMDYQKQLDYFLTYLHSYLDTSWETMIELCKSNDVGSQVMNSSLGAEIGVDVDSNDYADYKKQLQDVITFINGYWDFGLENLIMACSFAKVDPKIIENVTGEKIKFNERHRELSL
jgi:hypothetical protein